MRARRLHPGSFRRRFTIRAITQLQLNYFAFEIDARKLQFFSKKISSLLFFKKPFQTHSNYMNV